jgi:hypothetical protein
MGSPTPLQINDPVSDQALDLFLAIIHRDQYNITEAIYHDLQLLALSWEVAQVNSALQAFVDAYPNRQQRLFVPGLAAALRRRLPTAATLEQQLIANFDTYLDDPALLTLSLPVLSRVVSSVIAPRQAISPGVFDFLLRCLDQLGGSASILFRSVSIPTLTVEQHHRLIDQGKLEWSLVGDNIGRQVSQLLDQVTGLAQQLAAYEQRLAADHAQLEARLAASEQRLGAADAQLAARLSA